jgi:hypothetical protein
MTHGCFRIVGGERVEHAYTPHPVALLRPRGKGPG